MKKSLQKLKKKIFTLQNFFYHKKKFLGGGSSKTSPPEQNCCSIFKTVKSFPNGQRSRNLTWNYYCIKPNWIFPLFFTFISQRMNFFAKPKTQSYSFSPRISTRIDAKQTPSLRKKSISMAKFFQTLSTFTIIHKKINAHGEINWITHLSPLSVCLCGGSMR